MIVILGEAIRSKIMRRSCCLLSILMFSFFSAAIAGEDPYDEERKKTLEALQKALEEKRKASELVAIQHAFEIRKKERKEADEQKAEGKKHAAAGMAALKKQDWPAAEASFKEALKVFPTEVIYLKAIAEAVEHQNRNDEALGYYQAILNATSGMRPNRRTSSIVGEAKRKVSSLDQLTRKFQGIRKTFLAEGTQITKGLLDKEDYVGALDVFSIMSRLVPDDEKTVAGYTASLDLAYRTPPVEAPAGYRSLFNQHDFDGWRVLYGTWYIAKGILISENGILQMEKKRKSYKLKIVYRRSSGRAEDTDYASLWVHANDLFEAGSAIILTGSNAGFALYTDPDPKYIKTLGNELAQLAVKSPYKYGEWNVLDLTVNKHHIKVELNENLVYASKKETRIDGWEGLSGNRFPGALCLDGRGGIEIHSIFIKK